MSEREEDLLAAGDGRGNNGYGAVCRYNRVSITERRAV